MDFAQTWNEHFAHPFTWTYRGEGLHGKAVRRFIRLLQMESSQLDVKFLTKQLLLMRNLAVDYSREVDIVDWNQLTQLVAQKQDYLCGVISSGPGERQRVKAGDALEELSRMLHDSADIDLQAKPA